MAANILVVDDLLPNRRLLEAKLKTQFYDVKTAEGGKEAISLTKSMRPDIVLLDVMMPEVDGFEVCQTLKKSPETADIPIVMVTALTDVEDRVKGLSVGADDFITKPINDLALFARIRSLVRLKVMTDELKLRNKTVEDLGFTDEDASINQLEGAKVMLVDDNIAQAHQIKSKLSEIGVITNYYENPAEAVKASEVDEFDLIITSAQLTAIDGIGFCSHLRSQERTRNTPLLIIVEEDNNDLLVKALDMGINDYLITPIDSNEIIARVRTQVRRNRYQKALKNEQKHNIEMSFKDGLTGLFNRRYFDAHFERLLAEADQHRKPLSIVMLDMDHFKEVNDKYGHQSGDMVIKTLASLLTQSVRPTDLVARYGGEEFVILMPSTFIKNAIMVAERIRRLVERVFFKIDVEPFKIHKTISIGVSVANNPESSSQVLKRADKALYHVKNTGRNKVAVYNSKISRNAS